MRPRILDLYAKTTTGIIASLLVLAGWFALPTIASAEAAGQWQEKGQIIWNKAERKFVRRIFRAWDTHPELDLEFHWEADSDSGGNAREAVNGSGRLIWHAKGAAHYDAASIYSEYRGELQNGHPHGSGRIMLRSGLSYEGQWKNGLMEGEGVLRLPNGDEHAGEFVAGRPHGHGKYSAADGTVFEGSFRDGQRDGPGLLLTAEYGPYRSVWANGSEIERRLMQEVQFRPRGADQPIQLAQTPGRIVLNVYTDRRRNSEFSKEDDEFKSFVYDQINAPGTIRIRLASKEIMGLWKGDETIRKDKSGQSFALFESNEQFAPVFLVVDVANEGGWATQIVGGYLDVEESLTDLQPYLTIRSAFNMSCGKAEFDPVFEFVNGGWGEVADARVTYSFANESGARTQAFAINAGTFNQTKKVSVMEGLQILGVNTNVVRTRVFRCGSMAQIPACTRQLARSGVLGRLTDAIFTQGTQVFTRVVGKIEYGWADISGGVNQRQSAISVDIPLLEFKLPEEAECGAPGPVDRNLSAIELALDRKNYRIPINYRAPLAPRENKRFALSLIADKSSQHFFRFVLELADGSTVSTPKFDLLYFIPRMTAN